MNTKIQFRLILITIFLSCLAVFNNTVTSSNAQTSSIKKKIPDNDVCLGCHDDPSITMERKGRTVKLEVKKFTLAKSAHKYFKCEDCHKGFDPDNFPHKEKIEPVNCMDCHTDAASKHKFHPQMKYSGMNPDKLNLNCKGCHGTHEATSPKDPDSKLHFVNSSEYCGKCHQDKKEAHLKSVHSFEYDKNNPNAPTCIYCHKEPITAGYKLEKVQLKINQEKLCLSCHLKGNQTQFSKSLVNYEKSVHGAALTKGNKNAAVCIDCHGSHDLEKASSITSNINRFNVPFVCGKCHVSISNEYKLSTHGLALAKGDKNSPGCTYCHGEHSVVQVAEVTEHVISNNKMNIRTISSNKMIYCVGCHTNDTLMAKYNISTISKAHEWLPNLDTHYETVRCVDCHSSYDPPNLSHNILPPDKTVKQCGQCHSKNSILMTKLYKHEKEKSREKLGFINGTLLSDAYVVGTTRNVILDILSFSILGMTILGIGIHGLMRWYFRKSPKKLLLNEEEIVKKHSDEKTESDEEVKSKK